MQFNTQNSRKNTTVRKIVYNIMLFSMLYSSFVAPAQELVYAYFNQEEGLRYKGFREATENNPQMDVNPDEEVVKAPVEESFTPFVKKNFSEPLEQVMVSDIKHGFIGVTNEKPLDDASDNIFKVFIKDMPEQQTKVYLTYELYGLQDYTGVSRSINDRLSTGGHIVKYQPGWTLQKEEIDVAWLKPGENRIMFGIPQGANLQYQVKNLRIEFVKENILPMLAMDNPTLTFVKDNKLYVKGFLRNVVSNEASVFIENSKLSLNDGEFEGFLELTPELKQRKFAIIKAVDADGLLGQEIINFDNLIEADKLFPFEIYPERVTLLLEAKKAGILKTDGASIAIKDSALIEDKEISITRLRRVDVAPMASGMINVTKGGSAYRFLPDGTRFNKMVPITIGYDEKLIPSGYNVKDIKTYYFNTNSKTWIPVTKDSINEKEKTVISLTDHFTDYINGIIQTPESPETAGFTPTMMNDIKAADPSSEMTLISPPEVSQKGDANISYPIKIPSGRNGMQPQLSVQYNSEGGNGWLGQGWNINIPAITIDTRWGVPLLDPTYETEIYTLAGEQLMYPKIKNLDNVYVDWMPNRHYDAFSNQTVPTTAMQTRYTGTTVFTPRKQGSFTIIERRGTSPSDYYWKVINRDGSISWYGKNPDFPNAPEAVIKDAQGRIVYWGLFMTEDVNGNNIMYTYDTSALPAQSGVNSNLNGGKKFNISKIVYTGYKTTEAGKYEILFNKTTAVRADAPITARLGVKQIEPYYLSEILVRKTGATSGTYIRKYGFEMGSGQFKKGQLKAIREFGKDGVEFYKHDFEYYNDLGDRKKTLFTEEKTIAVPNFNADFTLGVGNAMNASRINSSESTEFSWDLRPAVGLQINGVNSNPSKLFTLGLPFGESKTKSKGKITMVDMDGNGLEDILFKQGNTLKYYPHLINTANEHYFSNSSKSIVNINNFSTTEGLTKTMALESVDFRIKKWYIGQKRFKTREHTDIYITDGNGDMLPDIVNNGKVYFNTGLVNNSNTFLTSSATTPNMLITAEATQINPDEGDVEEADDNTDYDVVRVWQAPATAAVEIRDTVSFTPSSPDSKVTYSIETDSDFDNSGPFRYYLREFSSTVTSDNILLNSASPTTTVPLGSSTMGVYETLRLRRGQKIFFRIHKNKAGKNDILQTDPQISYNPGEIATDQNGLSTTVYRYKDDFILSDRQEVEIPSTGNVSITWASFVLTNPSDKVIFKIIESITHPSGEIEEDDIYIQECLVNAPTSVAPIAALNFTANSLPEGTSRTIRFEVSAASNVKWKNTVWKPVFTYIPDANAQSEGFTQTITKYPVPYYSIFQQYSPGTEFKIRSTPFGGYSWQIPATSATYKALPNTYIHPSAPQLNSSDSGKFTFVVKKGGVVIGTKVVTINAGVINMDTTPITIHTGIINMSTGPIVSFEFYADGYKNLALFEKYFKAVSYHPVYFPVVSEDGQTWSGTGSVVVGYSAEWDSYPISDYTHFYRYAALAHHNANTHLGAMHRGWGQFLYNADCDNSSMPEDQYGKLINKSVIDNYVQNNSSILEILGLDIDGCDSEACIEQEVITGMQIPSDETEIDYSNVDAVVDNSLGEIDMSLLQQSYCMIPMHAFRYSKQSVIRERWIGQHEEQYSAAAEMRNGNTEDAGLAGYFTPGPGFVDTDSPELTADAHTGMYAISKIQKSVAKSKSAGRGSLSFSKSESSYSNNTSDFMDLNGDRYPDLLASDDIQTTTMTGGHRSPSTADYGYNPLNSTSSNNSSLSVSGSYPIAGRKDVETEKSDSGTPSYSAGIGLNANLSGDSHSKETLIDLNGDGLPERVFYDANTSQYQYKLNTGKSFTASTPEVFSTYEPYKTQPTSEITPSLSLSASFNDLGSVPFDVSLGYVSSASDTQTSLQDINGDGLADLLTFSGDNTATVKFNLGHSFSSEEIPLTQDSVNSQLSLFNNVSSTSVSLSGSASYFYGFPIFSFWAITIFLKLGVTGSASANLTISETHKEFKDFNGDGYADYVTKSGDDLKVYYSKIGRTDMLKTVTNPIGGKFEIDYEAQKVDYNNPNAKWAMTKVTVFDGQDKTNDGVDEYTQRFSYENGVYDRREREFYGYETVKIFNHYKTTISKYHNKSYFLNGLLMESSVVKAGDESQKYSVTKNTYEIRQLTTSNRQLTTTVLPQNFDVGGKEGRRSAAVFLSRTMNFFHEFDSTPGLITQVNYKYDSDGRLSTYTDAGNSDISSDDFTTTINYHTALLVGKNMSVPTQIEVKAPNTVRLRTTTVDPFGNILTVNAAHGSGNATTTMTYNQYGQLTQITYPPNQSTPTPQSMFYKYTYDTSEFNKYVAKIEDAYGNISTAKYNSDFDKITETTDLSGNITRYEYDAHGRTRTIRAPKEIASGQAYTIRFKYYPAYLSVLDNYGVNEDNFVPVALTEHFDPQNPTNNIETYTFIDGLARSIQVKKDIVIDRNNNPNTPLLVEALSFSGMTSYDEDMRASIQYHPYYELKSDHTEFLFAEYDSPHSSTTVYDEVDRPLEVTDAAGGTTTYKYSIGQDVDNKVGFKTETEVVQNNSQTIIMSEVYKDASGKVISTKNVGPSDDLWTKFNYNPIGELLSYTDAKELTTTYKYDLLGRKKSVQHPDNGITRLYYDDASNLTKLETTNLIDAGTSINYKYDFNRLIEIRYPDTPSGENLSNVRYLYGTTGNQKGKVICQKDATGEQRFDYGSMGEVVYNRRIVDAPNIPVRVFETSYNYDSWNRLQNMTYPDGEKVSYKYDFGGNLIKITGEVNGSPYDYVRRIDYDYYEQRTYLKYGNSTETFYSYTSDLRRLNNLRVKTADMQDLFNNSYSYDFVGNVTKIQNTAGVTSNAMGGTYLNNFTYDNLNRLSNANGKFVGDVAQAGNVNDYYSDYTLNMQYNETHGITTKNQQHYKNTATYMPNTYENEYHYDENSHRLMTITNGGNQETFNYDLNGNLTKKIDANNNVSEYFWDESNRLRVAASRSNMQHYIYDASGERVLKASSNKESIYENGSLVSPPSITFNSYTTYPSAFMVIDPNGIYSKHYYAGTQRIVSRIGDTDATRFEDKSPESCFGTKYQRMQDAQKNDLQKYLDDAKLGKASFKEYKGTTYQEEELLLKEEEGEEGTANLQERAPAPPAPIYYYHPDHLGTSTFLTDANGVAYQFFLNLPFGETMAEQYPDSYYKTPFKFSGKEMDDETGLHYFGARYYDSRISIWLSVDPMAEKFPNVSPYIYCGQNPLFFRDKDGNEPTPYEASLMAAHVYGNGGGLAGGWKVSTFPMPSGISNESGSGFKANFYEREKPDGKIEYAYVYAGTEEVPLDGVTDLKQAYGASEQYDQAIINSVAISNSLGKDSELSFVGHSLGGGLANASALKTNRKSFSFNPAWLSLGSLVKYGIERASDSNLNNYILEGEILNIVQFTQSKKLARKGNNHTVKLIKGQNLNTFDKHKIEHMTRALAPPVYKKPSERNSATTEQISTKVFRKSPRYN